jgi:hypothetical protein
LAGAFVTKNIYCYLKWQRGEQQRAQKCVSCCCA